MSLLLKTTVPTFWSLCRKISLGHSATWRTVLSAPSYTLDVFGIGLEEVLQLPLLDRAWDGCHGLFPSRVAGIYK